ncbi:hypothetical protein TrCOL_g8684 [Triparma columacea]|uniref:Uncharacterized protein n=1 Tax=Triparma columacea TaxID=722753 RepID=A0A9W7GEQ8_9STRA|nr:hypothetical protein TrCOL_g8684 [Triparma columacea]
MAEKLPSPPSASSNSSMTARQFQVLTELNATIATMEQIDGVLDDVNVLLSKDHPESVFRKQALCMKSLRKWETMVKRDMRKGGNGGGGRSPERKRKGKGEEGEEREGGESPKKTPKRSNETTSTS